LIDPSWAEVGTFAGAIVATAIASISGKKLVDDSRRKTNSFLSVCVDHAMVKKSLENIESTLRGKKDDPEAKGLCAIVQNQADSIQSMDMTLREVCEKINAIRTHQQNGGSKS